MLKLVTESSPAMPHQVSMYKLEVHGQGNITRAKEISPSIVIQSMYTVKKKLPT